MAIYSTLFLFDPAGLLALFPNWQPPLPNPVRRQFRNPFTGQKTTIETREPEWDDDIGQAPIPTFKVVQIQESYENYLEARLPAGLRNQPYLCMKAITQIEMDELAIALGLQSKLNDALYAPPTSGAMLQLIPPDVGAALCALDGYSMNTAADAWARAMSAPEHTHSGAGTRISDGWSLAEATRLLSAITELARMSEPLDKLYLLIET